VLDEAGAVVLQRRVDDLLQADFLALAEADVGGEDEARAAGLDAIEERPRAEAREDDGVDRADPDRGEEQDDRFGAERHVDRDAVALAEPEAAQGGGRALDFSEEQLVAEGSLLPPLVQVDKRRAVAAPLLDVGVERAVGQVRPAADEPLEARRMRFEDAVPFAEPGKRGGGARPEPLGVPSGLLAIASDLGLGHL
jgi:hypothetical protein